MDSRPALKAIRDDPDHMIDLRPYMVEHPMTVTTFESLQECLKLFVGHHLRHLIVVSPKNYSVEGIITRKDLFEFVGL